jgi:alkylation response protein AidB-like acyl-CoA dehydrogenase
MDYRDTPPEAEFRLRLRAWLAANIPAGWQDIHDDAEQRALHKQWHRQLYQAGYVGMSWPKEYGGQDLSPVYDAILNEEAAAVTAPPLPGNVNYMGRAMWTHGTDEQKKRFLPTLLTGEYAWCQGFSEPEAGSDIGSLRTRGVLDGDHYVVNGQKLWTSGAHAADWCFLLVRTDPQAPKHKGISCLLTPMDAPGISARPVVLASGQPETAEVFFENVRIPADQMLGRPGDGWRIAMTTLAYERGPGDVGVIARYRRYLSELEETARRRGMTADPSIRAGLAQAYVRGEVLRLNVIEQLSARVGGHSTGSEGSVAKLLWIDAEQSLAHLAMEILGQDALLGDEPEWLERYFSSRPVSVYGGTEQIQKNILAQRVLGMPR